MKRIITSIRRFWDNTSRWFAYRHTLRKVYDFDYTSILEVERFQIQRVKNSIAKFQSHENWKRDVAKMELALRLLDIIEEDGEADMIKEGTFTKKNNYYVYNNDSQWKMNKYVNTRNARRYNKTWSADYFTDENVGDLHKDWLRIEKTWHLYHKLRVYSLRQWWD